MPVYTVENCPTTVGWIKSLTAAQAIDQCIAWSLPPAPTLEENRGILRNFVRNKAQGQLDDEDDTQDLAEQSTSYLVTTVHNVYTPTTDILTVSNPLMNFYPANTTLMVNSCTTQTVTVSNPMITSHSVSTPLSDPNITQLVQSIHSITMTAISETAKVVAREIQNSSAPKSLDTKKLPPFLTEMMKDLPKLTGNDQDQTVNFFKKVTKLVELKLVPEKTILLNVGPYVQNRMREFWLTNVENNVQWTQLLANLRENFFTTDTLREIQNRFLYRPQKNREELSDYVRDIQLNFKVLSPQTPEQEIFNTIFRGINPETRTTFAGLPPLTKIQDLIDIAPLSASLLSKSQASFSQSQPSSPFSNRYYTHNINPSHPERTRNSSTSNPNVYRNYAGRNFRPNNTFNSARNVYQAPRFNHTNNYNPRWRPNNQSNYNNSRFQSADQVNQLRQNNNQPGQLRQNNYQPGQNTKSYQNPQNQNLNSRRGAN